MTKTLIFNIEKFTGCINIKNGVMMSLRDDRGEYLELIIPDELRLVMSIGLDYPG